MAETRQDTERTTPQTITPESDTALVVRRTFDAPREKVFAAWTDAASMGKWMRPGPSSDARAKLDVRVGGRFEIDMIGEGKVYHHEGEYLTVDPPRKLAFTWISDGTEHERSVVTVELFDRAGRTELVLTHERLPNAKATAGHRQGWTQIVEMLAGMVEG